MLYGKRHWELAMRMQKKDIWKFIKNKREKLKVKNSAIKMKKKEKRE